MSTFQPPLPRPLSFAQMLVRAQWRHEGRTPPAPVAVPAERRPAAQPLPRPPLLSRATGRP